MTCVQFLSIGLCATLASAGACVALGQTSSATTAPSAVATTTAGAATAPATQPLIPAEQETLIDQFNADDWHARQAAENKLVAMGEAVRPAMVWLDSVGTPEQRTRAESVLARLDQAAANRPTLITLHLKSVNPRDVFEAIGKQADLDIGFLPEKLWQQRAVPVPLVSVDFDQEPFWDAIGEICKLSGVRVQMMNSGGGGPRLTACQGNPGEDWFAGPRSVDGRFIVQPLQIIRNQSVSFAPVLSKNSTNLIQFQVLADPKVSVLQVASQVVLTDATDDKGNSLAVKAENVIGFQMGPALTFQVSAPLGSVDDGASKLNTLSGVIGVTVAGRVEHLDLPDATAAVNQVNSVGDWTLEITSCRIGDRDGSFSAAIGIPARDADPNMVFSVINHLKLVDADNRIISANGGVWSAIGLQYQLRRNFVISDPIHLPVSLKWDVPTQVEHKQISFHFTDIALPTP